MKDAESLMGKYLVRKESGTKKIPWTNGFGSLTILCGLKSFISGK